jgi:hypothetical protein
MQTSTAQVHGEPRALAATARLLDAVGGADGWAQARTIHIQQRGHWSHDSQPWTETYWMDLQVPRIRYEIRSGDGTRVGAWTEEGGWESHEGETESWDRDRVEHEWVHWTHDPKVIFRRLAAGTPATRVALDSTEGNLIRLTVTDAATGEALLWFALDAVGRPVKWSTQWMNHMVMDEVFGPFTDFAGVRLPAWGATTSGTWRYEIERAVLSTDPPPVSFAPPTAR